MLTENEILIIVVGAVLAVAAIAFNARWAFEALMDRRHVHVYRDADDLADRFEAALKDATVDLLGALNAIEVDTTAIRESNECLAESDREFEARQRAEREASRRGYLGNALDRYAEQAAAAWASTAGPKPDVVLVDDLDDLTDGEGEAIDLTKPERSQDGYRPTDLR